MLSFKVTATAMDPYNIIGLTGHKKGFITITCFTSLVLLPQSHCSFLAHPLSSCTDQESDNATTAPFTFCIIECDKITVAIFFTDTLKLASGCSLHLNHMHLLKTHHKHHGVPTLNTLSPSFHQTYCVVVAK